MFALVLAHLRVQAVKGKNGKAAAPPVPQLAPSLLADVPASAVADEPGDAALQAEIALTTELLMQVVFTN